jgi:hypothetical protein
MAEWQPWLANQQTGMAAPNGGAQSLTTLFVDQLHRLDVLWH